MAQNKQASSVPPDPTHFKSGGQDYFLYLGCAEVSAIQREWGYVHDEDSAMKHAQREITFNYRCEHPSSDDIVFVIQAGLGRWAKSTETKLTKERVIEILDALEPQEQRPEARGFRRAAFLYQRIWRDTWGKKVEKETDEGEADADPKDAGEKARPSLVS